MRRALIVLAGLLGFALGFVATFLVGIEATGSAECDGPCFEKWDEVSYVGYGIGTISGIAFALITRRLLANRTVNRS